ncbi:hypothetical protein ACFLUH_01440 [Chloroflexota bacterium]
MNCLICGAELKQSVCQGKRERRAIMLYCPDDGRHFRAFINEPKVVEVLCQSDLALEEALDHWKESKEVNHDLR